MSIELANTLIRAVDAADSSASLLEAVRNLSDAKLVEAIPTLIAALGYNNPGAAVAAVDGLIGIGKPAVIPLLELLDGYNYGARAWAIRALAGIGDPRALDRLLEAAQEDFALSVRRAAARGLGTVDWSDLPPDRVYDAQLAALAALMKVSQDHEWVVRYAAITGLQELAIAMTLTDTERALAILTHLDRLVEIENVSAVIARIWLAQKEIQNYAIELLTSQGSTVGHELADTLVNDWQSTLEKLYARKSQERPLPEGDPRRFRSVAMALGNIKQLTVDRDL
jgi:phycocyanobilin lyase beta subunit